ncbi:MAG TPA: M20/M25/M40 family metallo-hydrolase [Mesotoga sp.]|nr:M20/M25/M40 family metallo-hydrolase [Mesotoga sp.]
MARIVSEISAGRGSMLDSIREKIIREIEAFARFSLSGPGVTRLPFSYENDGTIEYIRERLRSLGKGVYVDELGNVASSSGNVVPADKTYIISHYDSVPEGGKYDGVAGLVFGLILLEMLEGRARDSVEMIAFNCEESSLFGRASIGSKYFFGGGRMPENYPALIGGERSLREMMDIKHYSKLSLAEKPEIEESSRFLKVHIDQSACLYRKGSRLGLVERIAGQRRLRLTFTGETGHSSLADLSARKDSLLPAASAIRAVRELMEKHLISGAVGTVTRVENRPNVMNMIPGETELMVDIRGFSVEALKVYVEELVDICRGESERYSIAFDWSAVSQYDPAVMNGEFSGRYFKQLSESGLNPIVMNSMAWHDIAGTAGIYPSNLLLLPNPSGVSHSPDESMDIDACASLLEFFMAKGVLCASD